MKVQIKRYVMTKFGWIAGKRAAQRLRLTRTGCQVGVGNVAYAPLAVKMTAFHQSRKP